ncbi:BolA family protein [Thalassovita aquimarina]|uniref:BolA family transcriptional regulator n=1 Tax=Thalassovita aquimarina TaxID=2785917 RepID=A0ABS5HQZ2_9RHOB|nr:BolA family transcriptional regulator [Thalassovita aquimarina]MBR9651217.1 BolA family transcriptional regulator [Thalassovita aquimarina]
MSRKSQIESRLSAAFSPDFLAVTDESEMHRGHAGYGPGGESHFRVKIRAAALADLSRIDRHRAIHRVLGADLISQIHALALEVEP